MSPLIYQMSLETTLTISVNVLKELKYYNPFIFAT